MTLLEEIAFRKHYIYIMFRFRGHHDTELPSARWNTVARPEVERRMLGRRSHGMSVKTAALETIEGGLPLGCA